VYSKPRVEYYSFSWKAPRVHLAKLFNTCIKLEIVFMQVNWSFKKSLASSVCALLLATSVHAIPKGPCEQPPVCCDEPKPGPFAFNYSKDMALACPSDFYFHADYLLLQPKQEGLEYAMTNTNTSNTFPITGGEILGFSNDNRDWDWDSGFRVGMGFYLNHDAWTIDLNWMWFKINEEASNAATNSEVLIPFWIVPGSNQAVPLTNNTASARWHLSMNVLDLSIGKPYHVSRYFIMNPFFGIRGAWFDQHYRARYGGLYGNGTVFQNGAEMDGRNDFWGVGTRAGMNTEWLLGGGWELLANLSFSFLFSKFDVDQEMALGTGTASNSFNLDFKHYQNTTNMELQLGVAWGAYFNKHQHHISLQLMYEFQEWFNQNQMRRFFDAASTSAQDVVSRGDLALNGLSVRLLFDF
jgi:hypothetical protein